MIVNTTYLLTCCPPIYRTDVQNIGQHNIWIIVCHKFLDKSITDKMLFSALRKLTSLITLWQIVQFRMRKDHLTAIKKFENLKNYPEG